MGKKKFIDKKNSATFQLYARDSSDPNLSAGPSGDRVFVRVDSNPYAVDRFFDEEPSNGGVSVDDPDSIFADAPEDYDGSESGFGGGYPGNGYQTAPFPDHIRREIIELGFPDDGYNYLAHLREIKNSGGGSVYYQNPKPNFNALRPDVKAYNASRVEISRLDDESHEKSIYAVSSKTVDARTDKVIDDEVAALLDDNHLSQFGSDVEDLEEDFVIKANLPDSPAHFELDKKLKLVEKPDVSMSTTNNSCFADAEDAGRLHNGDHVQSRTYRPLDEQFDLLELREYGTDREDDFCDYAGQEEECQDGVEKLNHALKDSAVDCLQCDEKYDLLPGKEVEDVESPEADADVIRRCREYAEKYENESEHEEQVIFEESSDDAEVWDCETIVSTYSNLDNHPGKIEVPETRRKKKLAETISCVFSSPDHFISLKGRDKLPVDFLPHNNGKNFTDKVEDLKILKPDQQKRKQHGQESKEEKKERKAAVKEERREARRIKKEIKGLYRCESQHAQKVAASNGPSSIHLM